MDVSHLDGHGWPQRVFVVPNFCVFFLVLSATISASEKKKGCTRRCVNKMPELPEHINFSNMLALAVYLPPVFCVPSDVM